MKSRMCAREMTMNGPAEFQLHRRRRRDERFGEKIDKAPCCANKIYNYRTRVIENKIRTENNEIIHMGVFPRRREALCAARAAGWRGVD